MVLQTPLEELTGEGVTLRRSRAIPERLGFTFAERRKATVERDTPARVGVDLVWRLERPRA